MNDSVILNADAYLVFIKKIFFIREKRHYQVKEVVISPPLYHELPEKLDVLNDKIDSYLNEYKSMSYKTYWFDTNYDKKFINIKNELELTLNVLANSVYTSVLEKAEEYPIIISNQRPFTPGSTPAKILAYFIPIGFVIRLLSRLFERRLNSDLIKVKKLNKELQLITERL